MKGILIKLALSSMFPSTIYTILNIRRVHLGEAHQVVYSSVKNMSNPVLSGSVETTAFQWMPLSLSKESPD